MQHLLLRFLDSVAQMTRQHISQYNKREAPCLVRQNTVGRHNQYLLPTAGTAEPSHGDERGQDGHVRFTVAAAMGGRMRKTSNAKIVPRLWALTTRLVMSSLMRRSDSH
jgi:hypothetical protein